MFSAPEFRKSEVNSSSTAEGSHPSRAPIGPRSFGAKQSPSPLEHFETIGRTLSICESTELSVGIPVLPPTRVVRFLRMARQGPLDEFLRLSLVEVPTSTLRLYAEELERALEQAKFDPDLKLFHPSFFERSLFPGTTSLFFVGIGSALAESIGVTPLGFWISALISGAVAAMASATLVSDDHRLATFLKVLNSEIYRRDGIDPEGSGNLRICVT